MKRIVLYSLSILVIAIAGLAGLITNQLINVNYHRWYDAGWNNGFEALLVAVDQELSRGREDLYHEIALQFEQAYECVDVIGIGEFYKPKLQVVWVIELTGDVDCVVRAQEAFRKMNLYDALGHFAFDASDVWACIRMDNWTFGMCLTPTYKTTPYPLALHKWPGRGK